MWQLEYRKLTSWGWCTKKKKCFFWGCCSLGFIICGFWQEVEGLEDHHACRVGRMILLTMICWLETSGPYWVLFDFKVFLPRPKTMFSLEVLYITALVSLHTVLSPVFKTFVIRSRQCERVTWFQSTCDTIYCTCWDFCYFLFWDHLEDP